MKHKMNNGKVLLIFAIAFMLVCLALPYDAMAVTRYFEYGGTNHNLLTANNWTGDVVPTASENAVISSYESAGLVGGNFNVNDLTLNTGALVTNFNNIIYATDDCYLYGTSELWLGDPSNPGGGTLVVNDQLIVGNQAEVWLRDSYVQVGYIRVNTGGTIRSYDGYIYSNGGFVNNGALRISAYGELTIEADGTINLDGTGENGDVWIENESYFTCEDELSDRFSGSMAVGEWSHATFNEGWSCNGSIVLYNNSRIEGGLFKNYGTIFVQQDVAYDEPWILSDVSFESTSAVRWGVYSEEMTLWGDVNIKAGATFNDTDCTLNCHPIDKTCTVEDGAVVGSKLRCRGYLEIEEDGIGEAYIAEVVVEYNTQVVLDIAGENSYDTIDTNYLNFGSSDEGTLRLQNIGNYKPDDGETFTLITYDTCYYEFDSYSWDASFDADFTFEYTDDALIATAHSYDSSMAKVPEPSTITLLFSALLAVGMIVMRKRNGK